MKKLLRLAFKYQAEECGQMAETLNLKTDELDAKRNARSESPMNSEQPSLALAPIAVPAGVRWREFRIQVLPLLAFVTSLVLAALLWQKTVLPVSVGAQGKATLDSGEIHQPAPPVLNPALHQASLQATNTMAKTPTD